MARRRSGGFEISELLLIVGIGAGAYYLWTKYKQSQPQLYPGTVQDMSEIHPPASTALILNPSGGQGIFIPGLDVPGSGGYTVAPGVTLPTQPPPGVEPIQLPPPVSIQPAPPGYDWQSFLNRGAN